MDIKTRLPQNLFPKLSECINLSVPITECDLSYKDHDLSIRTLIKYYKILTEQGYTKTKATNGWERLAAGLYRNNGTIGGGPMDNGPHYNGANQHEQRWLARHRMANSVGGLETIKWSQEFFSDRNPQTKNRSLASRFRALHDGLSRGDGKGNNLLRSLRESLSPPPGALRFGDRMIYIDEIIPVHELNYEHSANRPCRPIKRYGTEKRPPIGGTSMSQWVFIDLPTLAIMSCNYTDVKQLQNPTTEVLGDIPPQCLVRRATSHQENKLQHQKATYRPSRVQIRPNLVCPRRVLESRVQVVIRHCTLPQTPKKSP